MCGIDDTVKEYTYLYLDNITAAADNNVIDFLNSGICVKDCPKNQQMLSCAPGDDLCDKFKNNKENIADVYASENFLHFCFPNLKKLEETHPD